MLRSHGNEEKPGRSKFSEMFSWVITLGGALVGLLFCLSVVFAFHAVICNMDRGNLVV
jgi:hypothetical protein